MEVMEKFKKEVKEMKFNEINSFIKKNVEEIYDEMVKISWGKSINSEESTTNKEI